MTGLDPERIIRLEDDRVVLLDQRRLPGEEVELECRSAAEMVEEHAWAERLDEKRVTDIVFTLTYLFLGLVMLSFFVYPLVMVKFFAGLGVITLVYMFYYIYQERDLDFIYGILYSYFAFLLLNWVQPYAFITLRNDRWLTR